MSHRDRRYVATVGALVVAWVTFLTISLTIDESTPWGAGLFSAFFGCLAYASMRIFDDHA